MRLTTRLVAVLMLGLICLVPLSNLKLLPLEMAEERSVFPFALDGDELSIAMANPGDEDVLEEIGFVANKKLVRHVALDAVIRQVIKDAYALPGSDLNHRLEEDQFIDKDPGDLLSYSASLVSGAALPSWITFSPHTLTFSGKAPDGAEGHVEIEVVATDTENLSASGSFFLFFAARG